MSVVAMPIVISAMTSAVLRPDLSPMWPNRTAPIGRATNPTANVLNEAMTPTSGGIVDGKNSVGNTRAAAVA